MDCYFKGVFIKDVTFILQSVKGVWCFSVVAAAVFMSLLADCSSKYTTVNLFIHPMAEAWPQFT